MDVENKVPNVPGLVTTTVPNKKIREVGSKIPDTSWLATTAVIKFTSDILDAKTKKKNQPINLIATLATKAELKAE